MEKAACRGMDPNAFFPKRGGSHRKAKETCQSCKVCQQCGEYAIRTGTSYGIWGGEVLKRYNPR